MSGFPTQLPWRRFAWLLLDLGYCPLKSYRGSVRQFFNPTRSPNLGSFHEPHPGDTLHKATLYDSLRKLQRSPDEFVQLLGRRWAIAMIPIYIALNFGRRNYARSSQTKRNFSPYRTESR